VQTALNTKGPVYIGFDSNNDLDTTSLAAYGGSEDVVVAGWLDQSGNGNDASQATSANRPKIYDGTTGVVTENGKPAVQFDGTDDELSVSSYPFSQSDIYIASIGKHTDTTTEANLYSFGTASTIYALGFNRDAASTYSATRFVGAHDAQGDSYNQTQSLFSQLYASSTTSAYLDGVQGTQSYTCRGRFNSNSIGGRDGLYFLNGNIQEIVIYDSDQSTNRTDIEDNIGGYYDIPLPGLLDENPGAAAAYSLRRLSSTYTGSAIQVQRADNVGGTTDIGFDGYGDLDTAALTTAAAGNDMVVATWYDQSGNGNDASQATSANRPKIYDGTTGVVTENGNPAVEFDGTSDYLSNAGNLTYTSGLSIYSVSKFDSLSNTERLFCDDITGVQGFFIYSSSGYLQVNDNNTGYLNQTLSGADLTQQVRSLNFNGSTGAYNYAYNGSNTSSSIAGWTGPINSTNTANIGVMGSGNGSQLGDGLVQEIITYPSDQSANRTNIEDNIGGYYDIPLAGLLDENPGAAAAYSLRRLSSTYTGSAIQVQRADNVGGTHNIGFDSYGELDTTALTTAAQGNDMVVATWYDQSGNSNDASQATSANRPKIYDGTTGVILENGKPAVEFDGSSNIMDASLTIANDFTAIVTGLSTDTTSNQKFICDQTNSKGQLFVNSGNFNWFDGSSATVLEAADTSRHLFFVSADTGGSFVSIDGADQSITGIANTGYGELKIGGRTISSQFLDGKMQEVILYPSDQSANRTDIEDNIGGYYDIPLAGLLDENPGAAAAYSLRRLSSTYTGSAIQVQRADNVGGTTDIGFDSYGELDTIALTTAAAGNDMVVATWYDQSGNSNDATQGTSANRPKIYDGTTGVVTDNGKPAVEFSTSGTATFNMTSSLTSVQSVFHVSKSTRTVLYAPILGHSTALDYSPGVSYQLLRVGYSATYVINGDNRINGQTVDFTSTAGKKPLSQSLLSLIHTSASGNVNQITQDRTITTRSWDGAIQEIILYTSNQSSNRTDIEDNINTFYDIY